MIFGGNIKQTTLAFLTNFAMITGLCWGVTTLTSAFSEEAKLEKVGEEVLQLKNKTSSSEIYDGQDVRVLEQGGIFVFNGNTTEKNFKGYCKFGNQTGYWVKDNSQTGYYANVAEMGTDLDIERMCDEAKTDGTELRWENRPEENSGLSLALTLFSYIVLSSFSIIHNNGRYQKQATTVGGILIRVIDANIIVTVYFLADQIVKLGYRLLNKPLHATLIDPE